MATFTQAIPILARCTDISESRVAWSVRRLIEGGVSPRSVGKAVYHFNNSDLALVLIAICSGASGGEVVAKTAALASTRTHAGHVMPGCTDYKAVDAITDIVNTLASDNSPKRHDAVRSQIEICGSWPEIRITSPNQNMVFVEQGAPPGMWRSGKARVATTLPGVAIANIVDDISKLN